MVFWYYKSFLKIEITFKDKLVQSKEGKEMRMAKRKRFIKVRQILKSIIKINDMTNQWYDYYSEYETEWLCSFIKAVNTILSSRRALVLMAFSVTYKVTTNHGSRETI